MATGPHTSLIDVWSRTSSRTFETMLEANRAMAAAFGVPLGNGTAERPDAASAGAGPEFRPEERIEPGGDLAEWEVTRSIANEAGLSVGDTVRFTKTLAESDVDRFAAASGDTNPIHLDDERADDTRFGGRIVHGTLVAGLISAALARLPGSVVYLSQELSFQAPVRLGDRVTADVEVVEALGGDRFRLRTRVLDEGDAVIDGEAVVLIDETDDTGDEE